MENNKLVVKDNALIDASFNLSLIEQRLLLLAIVQARGIEELTSSTAIEIKASQYAKQFDIHEKESYNALKSACDLLFERRFSYIDRYKGNQLIKKVRWVSEIGYIEKQGIVLLNLSDTVISLISRLEQQFTKYHLDQVSAFKSKYSIRLYEVAIKWLSNGITQKYKIADLRSKLGLENTEYKTMSLFKANVLDKAVAEISSKSDLNIEYQQYKQGRIITHIQFKMKLKGNQPKENKKLKPKQMTAKQIDMYADKLSKLQSFQNFYLADAGQSLDDYRFAIVNKLQDEFYQKEWLSFLVETGFKPR